MKFFYIGIVAISFAFFLQVPGHLIVSMALSESNKLFFGVLSGFILGILESLMVVAILLAYRNETWRR